MKMVLHILGKDVHGLRWEIVAVAALTLATVMFELPGRYAGVRDLGQFWSRPVVLLGWILLVLRVVQRDGLVGAEQAGLTRRGGGGQVARARVAFVVLVVLVPLALRDVLVVAASGFPVVEFLPGLGWSLAVWIGVFLLPAAAIGVVTRTLPQALMGVLAVGLVISLMERHGSEWVGVDWVPFGLAALVGATVAGLVVWMQYRWRRAGWARAVLAAGVAASAGVAMLLPWGAAFSCQRLFGTERVETGRIAVSLGSTEVPAWMRWPMDKVGLSFPIEVSGAPEGYRLRVIGMEAETGVAGETVRYDRLGMGLAQQRVTVGMPKSEFAARGERPFRLRGRVYLAVLAPRAKQEFAFDGRRRMVPGVGLCEAGFERIPVFYCRSPYRAPVETRVTVWAKDPSQGRVSMALGTASSLSPLPFEFSLAPLRGTGAAMGRSEYPGGVPMEQGLTGGRMRFETWTPVAYVVREFEVTGPRLADYRTPFL